MKAQGRGGRKVIRAGPKMKSGRASCSKIRIGKRGHDLKEAQQLSKPFHTHAYKQACNHSSSSSRQRNSQSLKAVVKQP